MTDALHPDHLHPGDRVGPWLITQVLGRGGSSRVFKVERDGHPYSMKVALRPLSNSREELLEDEYTEEEYVNERSAYRRLAREAAALFTYSSHPNLLRVYGVDFWPSPSAGYPFLVTDYVDGETWHQWRWRKPPHATRLVHTFSDVVRTVGELHARGVYHRDLKAENLLIRRTDGRPFLIDFGTARLPGALTQTMGLPEGVLHLLPPELLAYARSEAWKRGKPFQGGVSADLYALGVLLYQGLTDLHPFNPELPDKELVAAIATLPPVAPHLLNPRAPRSLSDIALKLLEKQPEDRYPSTKALLQALEQAADKERHSPAWNVPLTEPDSAALEESKEQVTQHGEAAPEVREEAPPEATPSPEGGAMVPEETQPKVASPPEGSTAQKSAPPLTARSTWRGRWLLAVLAALLLVGALWLISRRATLALSPVAEPGASASTPRGNPPVPLSIPPPDVANSSSGASLSSLLVAGVCAATSLGCPAAQLRPEPANCPQDVTEVMFKQLKIQTDSFTRALVDIDQPGRIGEMGLYKEGPVTGRVTVGDGLLVEGTLLHGQLWIGPGLKDEFGREAVIGRYTRAVLPDGKEYPVCIALGGPDGRMPRLPGAKSGTIRLPRDSPVNAVWRFP
jgi:serine/threonine protein kinase